MKKNSISIFLVISILCFFISLNSAWAGHRYHHGHHYRWEGFAIGLGAAIIGSAIINHLYYPLVDYPGYGYAPPPRYYGHWEIRRTWMPPIYKRVWVKGYYYNEVEWVEGHYDQASRWIHSQYHQNKEWVPGHWESRADPPGHWDEERVWVEP